MGFTYEAEPSSAWDPGRYRVRLVKYEESSMQYGDVLTLGYGSVDNPGEEITEIVSKKATPGSKLSQRVCALSGVSFDQLVGRPFSLDKLIGKEAIAEVVNVEKDGHMYDRIERLLPARDDAVAEPAGSADASADDDVPF